jgi:thiol-disulfide isomerase/thioredoxin
MLRRTLYAALAAGAVVALALATGGLIGPAVPAHADATGAPVKWADARRAAPEITGITHWLNSGPLTLAQLRGKVVLVDFWTYGCINCVRTLPHVVDLYEKYKDKGLVVIGVHAPEFPHERSTANVAAAIKRHRIAYPVAQDNNFKTWNAYGNRYWPAQYIVDQHGRIVYQHAGEGAYDTIEQTVRRLLGASS